MVLTKRHVGSGNEIDIRFCFLFAVKPEVLRSWSLKIDYSRAPCLGADQKARRLWERDWPDVRLKTCAVDCVLYIRSILVPRDRAPFGQPRFLVLSKTSVASGDENVSRHSGVLARSAKIEDTINEVKYGCP